MNKNGINSLLHEHDSWFELLGLKIAIFKIAIKHGNKTMCNILRVFVLEQYR